jgi:hypothetical protein
VPDDLTTQVIAGLIVLASAAAVAWLWARRRRPLDWMATGKAAVEHRRRCIEAANHAQLVEWVLQRAEVLGIDIVVAVDRGPVFDTVTCHPSGRKQHYVRNHEDYARLLGSGLPYRDTFAKTWTGKPVSQWPDDQLRAWLTKHADELPPAKAPALKALGTSRRGYGRFQSTLARFGTQPLRPADLTHDERPLRLLG